MSDQKSILAALEFAITEEEAAAAFYTQMAERVEKAWMKEIFLGFAKEEEGHKVKLVAIKDGAKHLSPSANVPDIKLGDYLVEVETNDPDKLDYQSALVIAMKKEKAAFRLYSDLADATDNPELKGTLLGLAQEEAKHKLRFEVEYDDNILIEN